MDGDQKPLAPGSGWQNNPADNHPSLVEPSLPSPQAAKSPIPTQAQSTTAIPSVDENTPEGGFYHSDAVPAPAAGVPTGLEDVAAGNPAGSGSAQLISWTSSGESLRAPAAGWRVRMTIVSVIFGALIYLITRDFVSSGAVAVAGVLFGFLGARKPQALAYQMDSRGIIIGQKHYAYGEFRAFSVANDSAIPSVELAPLKRFAPVMSVQLDPTQHDQIIAMFSEHLPMEIHKRDAIDTLTSFLSK